MSTPDTQLAAFTAEVIAKALENAVAAAARPVKTKLRRTIHAVTDAYRPFLFKTYTRVKAIRTFLQPTESVDLLDHYVPVDLRSGQNDIDVLNVIERIAGGERIIISALAGAGKSVLMRYIALSFFHSARGRIPLFFELRNLNADNDVSLLQAIHEYYRGNSNIEFDDFELSLRNGYFILILDGFDEISPAKRNEFEGQIIRLSRDFDKLPIIVSGRHDERFNSWEEFAHLQLKEMTIAQTRLLIRKSNYDEVVKNVFLDRLTESFFEKHQSFLENPLLAIMMMLTFESYAEIPDSLHEFYRIAFDTLLRRHDAMKGQFLRESHSGCSTEQFKQVFSSFSLLTYSKSAFSFDRDRALSFLNAAILQQSITTTADALLNDLIESICLLQQEGFDISFVHRSFQEYFCAVFIANSASGFVKRYLDEADVRTYDNVLPMLMGIARQRVESEWAVDKVAEICDRYPRGKRSAEIDLFLACFPQFDFFLAERGAILADVSSSRLARELRILETIYPELYIEFFGRDDEDVEQPTFDAMQWEREVTAHLLRLADEGHQDLQDFRSSLARVQSKGERERIRFTFRPDSSSGALFRTLFGNQFGQRVKFIHAVRAAQRERQSRSNAFIGEVFGELGV